MKYNWISSYFQIFKDAYSLQVTEEAMSILLRAINFTDFFIQNINIFIP